MSGNLSHSLRGVALAVLIAVAPPVLSEQLQFKFDIPAQSLAEALRSIGRQTGTNVLFESGAVRGLKAPELSAKLTADEAIQRLLVGTKLSATRMAPDTIVVRRIDRDLANKKTAAAMPAELESMQLALAGMVTDTEEADAAGQQPGKKSKSGNEVEEMIVEEAKIKPFADANVDIPRTIDDAQAYYIFDEKTIERSGAVNLEDFLKQNLTMNTLAQTSAQQVGTAFATGPSSINLRGLGADKTLVLINGRRAAGTPGVTVSPVNNQPDLNGIAMSAIERIEVLPSSASAIYGGSALGGVVNVILKRRYTGGEVRANYDNTLDTDAPNRKISMSYGLGVNGGKTQISFNAQWGDSKLPLVQDRRELFDRGLATILKNNPAFLYTSSAPFFGALPNITSTSERINNVTIPDPGTLTLKNGVALNSRATYIPAGISSNTPLATLYAGLYGNAGKFNLDLPPTTQTPTGLLRPLAFEPVTQSLMASISHQLTPSIDLSLDVSHNENHVSFPNSAVPTSITIGSANPNNPFTSAVSIRFPSTVYVPFSAQGSSDSATLSARIKFANGWVGEADYAWSRARLYDTYAVSLDPAFDTALTSGALNPFVDLLAFPLDMAKYLAPGVGDLGSGMRDFAVRSSGTLVSLPTGSVTLSVGLERRIALQPERYTNGTYPITTANSYIQEHFSREQIFDSVYVETLVPLVKSGWLPLVNVLELQLAGRSERAVVDIGTSSKFTTAAGVVTYGSPNRNGLPYFDQASYTSGNGTIGIKYQPLAQLTLRASTATAFLPPTPSDLLINPLPNANPSTVLDPKNNGASVQVQTISGGNPNLRPQNSKSLNIGAIWEPRGGALEGLRFNAEYYRIQQFDAISSLSAQLMVDNEAQYPDRVVRDGSGKITFVDTSLINLYARDTQGWDLSADYRLKTGVGTFSLHAVESVILHLKSQYSLTLPSYDNVDFPAEGGAAKYKSNLQLLWDYGSWTAGWTARYFSSYKQLGALGGPNATRARATNPAAALTTTYTSPQGGDTIPSQMYHDLFLSYRFRDRQPGSGFAATFGREVLAGMTVQLGVKNAFNKAPPFDVFYPYYISPYADPRLRSYWMTVKKGF